jgi:hypothetical protein
LAPKPQGRGPLAKGTRTGRQNLKIQPKQVLERVQGRKERNGLGHLKEISFLMVSQTLEDLDVHGKIILK